jgi:serine/threonine protein kinase
VAEEVLGGYKLLKHMMTGQTSQVWEVVELASGRHFAMKLLLPEKAQDRMHRGFLFHEAEVGQQLAHPNIIRIIAVERSREHPHFVMEFFPAGNLKMRLMRDDHEFIHDRLQEILKHWATALAFMNAKGWVHRDVKPDNVLVNSAGELRLIDFALAQRISKAGLFSRLFRKKGKVQGTRSYMSPEQIRGKPLDGRADIYSFGASVYELLTGRPPFRASTSHELLTKHLFEKPLTPRVYNEAVTEEFAGLVLQMLAKKKEDRPKDFHEVLMAMRSMKIFSDLPGKEAK